MKPKEGYIVNNQYKIHLDNNEVIPVNSRGIIIDVYDEDNFEVEFIYKFNSHTVTMNSSEIRGNYNNHAL